MPSRYTDEQRRRALTLVQSEGLAKASKDLGIPKSTIKDWAKDADVDTAGAELVKRTQAATEASKAIRATRTDAALDEMLLRLEVVARAATETQIDWIMTHRQAVKEATEGGISVNTLRKLKAMENIDLHDVVGAGTRAIGDMLRIRNRDTADTGMQVNVQFVTVTQDQIPDPDVIQLGPDGMPELTA